MEEKIIKNLKTKIMTYDIQQEANDIIARFDNNRVEAYRYACEILSRAKKYIWFWKRVRARVRMHLRDNQLKIDFSTPKKPEMQKLSPRQRKIYQAMLECGTFALSEISNKTGIKQTDLSSRVVKEFKKKGMIQVRDVEKNRHGRKVIHWEVVK